MAPFTSETKSRLWIRYGPGLLGVVAVYLIFRTLPGASFSAGLILYLVAILVGAWHGGLGPGIAATLLSCLAISGLDRGTRPAGFWIPNTDIPLLLFFAVGLLASWLLASARTEPRRLHRGREEKARQERQALLAREHAAREELFRALRISERRYRSLVEAMSQVVWTTSSNGEVLTDIPAWRELTGRTFEESKGLGWLDDLHPDDRERVGKIWQNAVANKSIYDTEYRIRLRDGTYRHMAARGVPVFGEDGVVREWIGICADIHERRLAEERQAFLARAGELLTRSLDFPTRLEQLTRLAVPLLADACYVHVLQPDGQMRLLAEADTDPDLGKLAWELDRRFPVQRDGPHGLAQVLRTGEPLYVPAINEELFRSSSSCEEHYELLKKLGWKACMAMPLVAQGKIFGTLLFCLSQSKRHYTPADVSLGRELALRASVALDNARLFSEAQDSARTKDEFLAMLAHELRNPMAPIMHALNRLNSEALSPEGEQVRLIAERQVGHMARLIDDLLDVARITRGHVLLRREPVELRQVMRQAVDAVEPMARALQLTLEVEWPAQSVQIEADPTRLEQILGNLLNNAIKYTEPGGRVTLSADVHDRDVVIHVRDTGIGIEPELLPHVFDLFSQADKSLNRPRGGLGIGLTLVRRLVEMHGGRVVARSPGLGQGSEFDISLPVISNKTWSIQENPRQANEKLSPSRRVLIVDDNADAAQSLALLLRVWGNEVSVAHDGPAALASVQSQKPDVVFLDIGLPGMDGYQVARRLREEAGGDIALLVAMTGYGQEEDRKRSREAGFDQHLVKPVEPETLRDLLGSA